MLPPLVAADVRRTLTEFLGTTFALADGEVRQALETFLRDPEAGIFRGPFVRVKLPFRPAQDGWRSSLAWAPAGFAPYHHQAQAFARLSSLRHEPQPTIVTTGTGSGKTESFLVPVLDHCRRARSAGSSGIKALLLYPMNALANDQARRIAQYISSDPQLRGIRAGLYVGRKGSHTSMGPDHVIDDRETLRYDPPDILLTNYKMLDFLLLRPEDRELWVAAADTLRYLVLDEFHTYDGAQGTDVAMLLRRLGATLGVAEPGRALGAITPVGTSATLGGGPDGSGQLLAFAAEVFGCPFPADAIIAENRLTPGEWLTGRPTATGPEDPRIPLFGVARSALAALREDGTPSHQALTELAATQFLPQLATDEVRDPVALATALLDHPLTARIVEHAVAPIPLDDLVDAVLPTWTLRGTVARDHARDLLSGYLGLLARARVLGPGGDQRPLLLLDVQLWVREVSRLLRLVGADPRFQWGDKPVDAEASLLPAVYCRHCGRSGWAAVRKTAGNVLEVDPKRVWRDPLMDRSKLVALLHAPGEAAAADGDVASGEAPAVHWYHPASATVESRRPGDDDEAVPVLAPVDVDAARRDRCPACGQDEGIRFLGSRVATLVSVALGHLFASPDIESDQKKTLVFTDSVQDAAHRAAFVEARAYSLNLRSAIAAAVDSSTPLDAIGRRLAERAAAGAPGDRYALLPPDLQHHSRFARFWAEAQVDPEILDVVARRLQLSAVLEFGLQSRTGRTLELTGSLATEIALPSRALLLRDLQRTLEELPQQQEGLDLAGTQLPGTHADRLWSWTVGAVERIRTLGGIEHPYFAEYVRTGERWSIWGGRTREMGWPAFPSGRSAPQYPKVGPKISDNEPFDPVGSTKGWWAAWARKCLGVVPPDAPATSRALLDVLAHHEVLEPRDITGNATVWLLRQDRVRVATVSGDELAAGAAMLRCDACAERRPGRAAAHEALLGAPCLRAACPGRYTAVGIGEDYYRSLYLTGAMRRIVAREHTGLLPDDVRAVLEDNFKQPRTADAPNVLTCTPTLELGIDIGDLSVVTLTSLPRRTASYLQRVGRAGRRTGNALVLSVLPSRALELQRLADPLSMLAGEVTPPACHLDATEILQRQYLAFVLDRAARAGRPAPRTVEQALELAHGAWLTEILREAHDNAAALAGEFLALFGDRLTGDTRQALSSWAGVGAPPGGSALDVAVRDAAGRWRAAQDERHRRLAALDAEWQRLVALGDSLDDEGQADRRRVRGERARARAALKASREQYWIAGLEELGLLPNYDLIGDGTTLDVSLWWTNEETGESDHTDDTYIRGSAPALRELAPGAVFYVRGSAVHIDAVDQGPAGQEVAQTWRVCPSCSWSDQDAGPMACPRCGDAKAADVGQVLTVLPFRGASAYEPRDQAVASDDREDRDITPFTIVCGVDVEPGDITRAWQLKDYSFGVEFCRVATVRWLNVGQDRVGGATRHLMNDEVSAPLFHVCRSCGVVPGAQRNRAGRRIGSAQDARHRGWCPQRRMFDPAGWRDLALSHELRTQALRLLVPQIDLVDPSRLESFRAALLLGLREILGGDPDHLAAVVSMTGTGSGRRPMMVLHDTVPGGTGYLAQISSPEQVHRLLTAARRRLEDCPCADEPVLACHRCLLAHVEPRKADLANRAHALDMIRTALADWVPEEVASLAAVESGESPLEVRFRQALRQWLDHRNVTITESAAGVYTNWMFHLPSTGSGAGAGQAWTVTPQVDLGYCRPDFLLSTPASQQRIAVFLDGQQYHCSIEHNRLADDAAKRARLRGDGYLVWAITADDLVSFLAAESIWEQSVVVSPSQAGPRDWAGPGQVPRFEAAAPRLSTSVPGGSVPAAALSGDAMTCLLRYLQRPEPWAWRGPARALALSFVGTGGKPTPRTRPGAMALAASTASGDPAPADGTGPAFPAGAWLSARGAGVILHHTDPNDRTAVDVIVAVDDRPATVGTPAQVAAWQDWLTLSNVLQFVHESPADLETITVTSVALTKDTGGRDVTPDSPVEAWLASTLASVGERWHTVLGGLTRDAADAAAPGYETDEGVPLELAWPDLKVALRDEQEPDVTLWLTENGWEWAHEPGEAAIELMQRHGLVASGTSTGTW